MAKNRVIPLIGGISEWNISHDYVRYMMDQLDDGPITVQCTSPGGDVNQALLIKALFEEHGDVTVEYVGFNASAATIIGHGAKHTAIREDSMFLVHKPAVLVETWGRMNSDELAETIAKLEGKKQDAEKMTLMIAQGYVNSRGMEMSQVMDLMKDARWLTSNETVDLGLVDELLPSKTKNPQVTNEVLAMMSVNGYPVPKIENEDTPPKKSILNFFTKNNSPKNPIQMQKNYSFVNEVLGVEGVNVADNKVEMTVEQIVALNTAIEANTKAVATLTTEKQTAVAAQQTAETALNNATAQLDAIDPTVQAAETVDAKIVAITAKLASRPGVAPAAPSNPKGGETITDETDWDVINALPHNQAADKEI